MFLCLSARLTRPEPIECVRKALQDAAEVSEWGHIIHVSEYNDLCVSVHRTECTLANGVNEDTYTEASMRKPMRDVE